MNLVERLLAHPADQPALTCPTSRFTYGELADRAARWRGALAEAEVEEGDRVVVLAANDDVFVTANLAVVGRGAAMVPLNPASPPAELAREVAMVQGPRPPSVIVAPSVSSVWEATAARLAADAASDPDLGVDVGAVLTPDLLDAGPAMPTVDVASATPAALLFTSGTAGPPRPAVLTHGNLEAALRAVASLPLDLVGAGHVILAVIPLFHVFGYNAVVNLGLSIGAELVVEDYSGPDRLAEAVADHGVTILAGPPTLWGALVAADDLTPERFASVRLALSGAAKLAPPVRLAAKERLGLDIDEGYGLTETAAMVATSVGVDAPVGSVGQLLPGVEGRLVDPSGDDVLIGDPGELWIRGPMVSPGYHGDDPLGRRGADPAGGSGEGDGSGAGWLRTGDVAVVDEHGNLAIVDRVKDLIIVSGFNVFPGEVEAALAAHPDVAAAGVVGQPDERTGEAVLAYVVPVAGATIDEAVLVEHCRDHLARYKVPARIETRSELPVGAVGKLRRRDLS